jgi:hypothetical protein
MKILKKVRNSILNFGIVGSLRKIPHFIRRTFVQRKLELSLSNFESLEDRFTAIYKSNYWGSNESISGTGSTLEYTANIRKSLPVLFKDFNIESVLDAPCGDFHWMKHVLINSNINYLGGDIVDPMISSLCDQYSSDKINFLRLDITKDKLPDCDLLICRDVLFHLSYTDIKLFLNNFSNSNIKFILTSTHINLDHFSNHDILSGGFRRIDLFSPPFNLVVEVIARIDDYVSPEPPREMCLWSREQIIESLKLMVL